MIPDAIPGGRPPGRPTSARDRRGDPAGPAGGLRVAAVAHGFPPWPTVCSYPPLGRKAVWAGVHRTLVMAGRERTGREASSSAAILDGRTLRTAGRKKIQRPRGRKAHPRPQASHPDGSRGPAARGRGPGRRPSSGPRRGEGRPQAIPAALSLCRASWPPPASRFPGLRRPLSSLMILRAWPGRKASSSSGGAGSWSAPWPGSRSADASAGPRSNAPAPPERSSQPPQAALVGRWHEPFRMRSGRPPETRVPRKFGADSPTFPAGEQKMQYSYISIY